MIKIINGKRYNTETATLVAENWNGLGRDDISYIYEQLFLSKNGQWFVSGDGGAYTKYGVNCGNGTCIGSRDIYLYNENQAKKFIEEYGELGVYEKYFPVVDG